MSVIGADVLGASQLFPDVENEPKVADDALIDVSNRTDVLFCWMYRQYRQWRAEAWCNKEALMSRTSLTLPTSAGYVTVDSRHGLD